MRHWRYLLIACYSAVFLVNLPGMMAGNAPSAFCCGFAAMLLLHQALDLLDRWRDAVAVRHDIRQATPPTKPGLSIYAVGADGEVYDKGRYVGFFIDDIEWLDRALVKQKLPAEFSRNGVIAFANRKPD